MRRVLLVVNVLIALALIGAGAAFYWYLYRALPQTAGTIRTLVRQPVEVNRDRLGVPHIKAASIEDALFVEGYTVAEDRMWQMDILRRLSAGELSEVLGSVALEADRESRSLRLRRIAELQYASLSSADRALFAAYARGVNAYIDSHHGRYGFEFSAIGYDPRPWSTVDSLLIGLHMFRTLTNNWKTKLIKEQMLRTGDPEKVTQLFPVRGGLEILPGGDIHPGSNAWAVSGKHTATGKPVLSNDTHLEFSNPGIWHMTHLQSPGLNTAGLELPGVPGVIIGHNDRIAWGVTNLGFETQDLYIERMDMRTGRYLFQNQVQQAQQERELILVKDRAPEQMQTWVTRHGPVFSTEQGRVLTLRWTAADPSIFHDVFFDIDKARNWDEFKTAISEFGGPGQNFVYADVDGNIGYHAAGKLPIRRDFFGDVPVDGSSGKYEWDGYIPFDELPQVYNPPSGFVVTANQNPFPPDFPYHVSGNFASRYRSRQILDMLVASGNKLKPEDDLRIEKDVYSGFQKFLARQVVAAYDKRGATNPVFTGAVAMLRTWDGQMDKDRPEPFITTLAFQYIRKAVAERASPGSSGIYDIQLSSAIIERILRERPGGWFADYNELLLRCFADAMEEGQRMQGADPKRWRWGKYMFIEIPHPVAGRIPLVGKYFNIGPEPMSGGSTTVKQTTRRLGPSERMDLSLANWDDSLLNIPIGESGHIASSHFKDEWDAYYNGRSFPMQFGRVESKGRVTFVPAR
ncbi:MAG TPA: penicillin acylase family protein [Bryobacteraceae bacterium]|nr:penicillin acylase family protein [Bryobacteraceae bacterium]